MGLEVDVSSPPVGDVRVALRRPEVGVAEHLLHGAEVRSALEEMRRERVPEEVGVDAARLEACPIGQLAQDEKGTGAGERAAACVEEELRAVAAIEVRAAEREVPADGLGSGAPERYEALFATLAEHADDALLDCDAALLQACGLGDAKPRAVEELHERAIAECARHRAYRCVDQPFGLGRRERAR